MVGTNKSEDDDKDDGVVKMKDGDVFMLQIMPYLGYLMKLF